MTQTPAPRQGGARWVQVVALAIVGVILSVVMFRIAKSADSERVERILEFRAEWRARDMERKLALAGKSAEALAIYLSAGGEISAARFHNFARLAHDHTDLDSVLYWAPWVAGADRSAFVAASRRDVDPNYDITEVAPNDQAVPAAARAAYLPQLYQESFDNVADFNGFDLLSRPERKAQVERVRDSGVPIASAPFALLMGGARVRGFNVLWPVYTTGVVPQSVELRRAAFRGVAAARFRLDHVLPGLIADTPDLIEAVDFLVGSADERMRQVAAFDPVLKRFTIGDSPVAIAAGSVTIEQTFSVFGLRWTLRSHFAPATAAALTSTAPGAWLVFGLLATAILVVFASRQATRLGQIEVIASERDHRFRRLFEDNPIGMVLATSADYRYVRVNAAFCRMVGYTAEELVGHMRDEFAAPESQNMPPAQAAGIDPGWHAEDKHYLTKSGATITTRVCVMRLAPTSTGEALVLKLVEEVTEQRKLEERLRQTQKMEAIGQLTGGMAHDFNNLLGIIIGNLDLLQPLLNTQDEAGELVNEVLAAALRGADLTQRLLAFARRQPLRPIHIALNQQVTEIAKLLTRTLGERVRISLDLSDNTWPVLVDPVQFEACIINLATNARDAMPQGGTLSIGTGNRQLDADYAASHPDVIAGDYAMVEVSDTGTGMAPDILARIFEPFFTTKGPGKGTGLGLSMVFGFLKQSNGHISAYSEPGVGTTFRLYLPRAEDGTDEWRSAADPVIRRGDGETVLVVEDNEPLRRVVARQLTDLGYAVIEVADAVAALDILAREPVALVFTDIVMPGELDGFGLTRVILDRWPSMKVLLTSGFPETKIDGALDGLGGSARLLGKPYRTTDLAHMVREAIKA